MNRTSGFGADDPGNLLRRRVPPVEQQETLPLKAVRRGAAIDELDTLKTSAIRGSGGSRTADTRISAWVVWLASFAVVAVGLAIYARSIHILPLSDDWGLFEPSVVGPQAVFFAVGNYHYNPVTQGLIYVLYLLFGINPVPYHVVTLTLFSVSLVLMLHLGWKVTGSFTVGALAALLFVLNGRQYEGVVWTVVSLYQTLGLALYLGGLLFYLHAQGKQGRRRVWLLVGFYTCMILAIFAYEQEISLIVACMLYRLFVIEHGAGWNGRALLARARVWALEFGFPLVFFAAYLGFKYWLGLQTGRSQAPGLSLRLTVIIPLIVVGLYESFIPGIVSGKLWALHVALVESLAGRQALWTRAISFIKVLAPLGAVALFARPVYRWLVLWSAVVVASTVVGIGYLASRYFLLFIVPAAILWAAFLVWLAKVLRRLAFALIARMNWRSPGLQRVVPALTWLPVIALLAVYGGLGLQYTFAQLANWQEASDIESAALQRIETLGVEYPAAQTLYLINVPDNLLTPADPTGHFEHGAYLFQDGAATMVQFSVPGRFQHVSYLRTPDYQAIGTQATMSRDDVAALTTSPSHLVVCFSNQTRQIEPWGPLCT